MGHLIDTANSDSTRAAAISLVLKSSTSLRANTEVESLEDVQVVPAAFVDEATGVDTTTDPASHYQYYWWIDEGRNSYYAQGDHCQYIYVAPSPDVVLVRHGRTCGDTDEIDVGWVGFLGGLVEWLGPQLTDG